MKCLETRRRDGMKWRRYRTDDGRTITTYEVPASVLRAFSRAKVQEALERWERGQEREIRAVKIREMLAQRIKPTAIAYELGVTEQRVRQIRKQMQQRK